MSTCQADEISTHLLTPQVYGQVLFSIPLGPNRFPSTATLYGLKRKDRLGALGIIA